MDDRPTLFRVGDSWIDPTQVAAVANATSGGADIYLRTSGVKVWVNASPDTVIAAMSPGPPVEHRHGWEDHL